VLSIEISMFVCPFAFRCVCSHISTTTCPNFIKFSAHAACGRGSVHCVLTLLPVLWMASRTRDIVISVSLSERLSESKATWQRLSSCHWSASCALFVDDGTRVAAVCEISNPEKKSVIPNFFVAKMTLFETKRRLMWCIETIYRMSV